MYKQRLKIFLGLTVLCLVGLAVRLAQLQTVRGDYYREQAQKLMVVPQLLPTIRGHILDRTGKILATDESCYEACLDYRMLTSEPRWVKAQVDAIRRIQRVSPEQAQQMYDARVGRTWELLEQAAAAPRNELAHAAQTAIERVEAIRQAYLQRHMVAATVWEETQPQTIVGELDEAQYNSLNAVRDQTVGLTLQPAHRRQYPYGAAACHVIGVLGEVSKDEMEHSVDPEATALEAQLSGYLSGDVSGKSGVEKLCEDRLRGRRGFRTVRRTGEVIEERPAETGQDVHLSIDIELQRVLTNLLPKPGAIVVLDIESGEVLAMVSTPTYDLNLYRRNYELLSQDHADLTLWNKAVAVRYPPGSTLKPLVALSGLATQAIRPDTTFNCVGYLHQPDQYRCLGIHGRISVLNAIERSCNVFFYNVGELLGTVRLGRTLTDFGYRDRPGTGLSDERAGIMPPSEQELPKNDARLMGIGQGPVLATPLHVANGMAAIARRGQFRSPVLVRELASGARTRQIDVPAASFDLVSKGMDLVVNSPQGSGHRAHDPAIPFAGKTGTAQTPARWIDRNGNHHMDADEILRSGDTAWFAGYAPYRNPRIAFVVMIEYSDQFGGKVCAPIAKQVVNVCKQMGYLP